MRCPICKSELVVTGQERLETLLEHVSAPNDVPCLKNKFECSNETCSSKNVVFWNEGGELYIHKNENAYEKYKTLKFIDNNYGPFNSTQRQINVEISKKDENFFINENGKYRIEVKYVYTANKNGDILKRKRTYELSIYNKDIKGYIRYVSGLHMFIFNVKQLHYNVKRLKEGAVWAIDDIKHTLEDKGEWWRNLSAFYAKLYLKFKNVNI